MASLNDVVNSMTGSGVVDNSSGYQYNPLVDNSLNVDWKTFLNALPYGIDAIFGTNIMGNKTNMSIAQQNLAFMKETNLKNEQLLRESWQRDDSAVQRRVADLKAAGLSPTLAAGSAAAASSPIQLKAPQNQFHYENPFNGGMLSALSQVMTIKNMELQNELLGKQVSTFGEPAWFKGLNAILDKIFSKGEGPVSNVVDAVTDFVKKTIPRFGFKPEYGLTFGTPPSGHAASTAIGRSAVAHGATFDESTMTLTFDNSEQARDWYLSIGGTTAEWYYGVRKYDNKPVKFIEHIIEDGYITRDGDVYLDR